MNTNSTNYLQVDYGEIEKRNTLTFGEFKMWLQGLIEGKGGKIPDLEDWKRIKKMMDKVYVPAPIIIAPVAPPANPIYPNPIYPYYPPISVPMVPTPSPLSPSWTICGGDLSGGPVGGTDYDLTKLGHRLEYDTSKAYGPIGGSNGHYITNNNSSNT